MQTTFSEEVLNLSVKEILEDLGYLLRDDGGFFRTKPLYRNSNNPTSLRVHKESGRFVDFSTGQSGSLAKLIRLTCNLETEEDAKKYLIDKNFDLERVQAKPKLSFSKFYTFEDIGFCVTNYKYFNQRGISNDTQEDFGLKYCTSGKMAGRVVAPIYDENSEIIAFAGRSVFENHPMKWKIIGPKTECIYPLHLNLEFIKEKRELILVEGISDVLKLWDSGIKNVICLFGTVLNSKLKSFIISLNLDKIIIATNNEPDNEFIGNKAAEKVYNNLARFYSKDKIQIKLPTKKDFGEMELEEILNWSKL